VAVSDRARAVVPYVEQLLYDQELQEAIGRAGAAARETYLRSRAKSARQAAKDKKLRRRFEEAAAATWDVWTAIAAPRARQRPPWRRRVALLMLGGAGVFLAFNAEARQAVLGLTGDEHLKSATPPQ